MAGESTPIHIMYVAYGTGHYILCTDIEPLPTTCKTSHFIVLDKDESKNKYTSAVYIYMYLHGT